MMNNSQRASSFFSGLSTLLGRPHPLLHNLSDTTFVTYHALNGSGYVRLLNRQGREQADAVRDNPLLREQFAARYVEHMMIGFNTITYIGF